MRCIDAVWAPGVIRSIGLTGWKVVLDSFQNEELGDQQKRIAGAIWRGDLAADVSLRHPNHIEVMNSHLC